MSAFKKPLPFQMYPLDGESKEPLARCFFEAMEPSFMRVRVGSGYKPLEIGTDLSIEFIVAMHRYQFDSVILSEVENGFFLVRKPKVIYKRAR